MISLAHLIVQQPESARVKCKKNSHKPTYRHKFSVVISTIILLVIRDISILSKSFLYISNIYAYKCECFLFT